MSPALYAQDPVSPDAEPEEVPIPSYTVPVVYINTVDQAPIVDKINPIDATLHITVPEGSDYPELGTPDEGIKLTIRGRGNASWVNSPKKPYKLKFEKKQTVLGMPKSKHFALLHHNAGWLDYFASMAGMELARITGEPWAPHMVPVELVLNGSYDGLYFLAETIKIDENRLNIYEQEELNEDPELIPHGWLVEIDNYEDEFQIMVPETESINMRVTHHAPEILSDAQREWLINEFTTMVHSIYHPQEAAEAWESKIDVNSAARYFLVRELLHDTDGYNGSFYMHRDLGEDTKWNFGPLWDLCTSTSSKKDWIINDHPSFSQVHLIEAIMQSEEFLQATRNLWEEIYPYKFEAIYNYIDEIAKATNEADIANAYRWPQLSQPTGNSGKAAQMKYLLGRNASWIDNNLSLITGIENVTLPETDSSDSSIEYFNLQGMRVSNPADGVYIRRQANKISKVIL